MLLIPNRVKTLFTAFLAIYIRQPGKVWYRVRHVHSQKKRNKINFLNYSFISKKKNKIKNKNLNKNYKMKRNEECEH